MTELQITTDIKVTIKTKTGTQTINETMQNVLQKILQLEKDGHVTIQKLNIDKKTKRDTHGY